MPDIFCPVCKSNNTKNVFTRKSQPVSVFWQDESDIPVTDVDIHLCRACSFIYLKSAYSSEEFSKVSSKVYNSYLLMDVGMKKFPADDELISNAMSFLRSNVDFSSISNVLEVGSNRGDFLYHIKSHHRHINAIGVEPSKLPFYGIPTINSFYSSSIFGSKFDLVIIRHVLEHIINPLDIVRELKDTITPEGKIFIEVPNVRNDLKYFAEPFIAEHVNYYASCSLQRLLNEAGLYAEVLKDDFSNSLYMIASGNNGVSDTKPDDDMEIMLNRYVEQVHQVTDRIVSYIDDGYKIIGSSRKSMGHFRSP